MSDGREEYRKRRYQENKETFKMKTKEYYKENRELILEKQKEYIKNNKEKISERRKEYRLKNKEKTREYNKKYYLKSDKSWRSDPKNIIKAKEGVIKSKYGIGIEELSDILDSQKGCCKICKETLIKPDSQNSYHIDHSHSSGRVRGLLCSNCNMSLGLLHENKETILSMYNYLVDD